MVKETPAKEEVNEAPQVMWGVGQIPKETKEVIVNLKTQQPLIAEEGIALILNKLDILESALATILKKLN